MGVLGTYTYANFFQPVDDEFYTWHVVLEFLVNSEFCLDSVSTT